MTPADIWATDLFKREAESDQLIGFLETVAIRPSLREDGHAYVLAVDAPYGEGKSFFLRRFAKHMALTHPVAFVDAWTDDLEDEPLVALAATIDQAFSELKDDSGELRTKLASVLHKTGRVARIATGGLVRRGIGLIVTPAATDAISAVLGDMADHSSEAVGGAIKDTLEDASDHIGATVTSSMQKRIDRFNEGRDAVKALKESLRDLIRYLSDEGIYPPPIVIVIDELDRCRPTYAIKLLEEIKHLFDVEGLAFVLGMHGDALSHSVSAAYGASFDGAAYLNRFIDRRYRLREAPIYSLLNALFEARGLSARRLQGGKFIVGERNANGDVIALIALMMKTYGMNARDTFAVVDSLEVCLALTGEDELLVPYLLPLIFNFVRGKPGIARLSADQDWTFLMGGSFRSEAVEYAPDALAARFHEVAGMTNNQLSRAGNSEDADFVIRVVASITFTGDGNKLSVPRNYENLLRAVSRFTTPTFS